MPKYKYDAVSSKGESISGDYIAPDENSVVTMLKQGGFYATKISLVNEKNETVSRKRVKPKVLAGFCIQMSSMIKAGIPISRILGILSTELDNRNLRKIVEDVYRQVLQGVSLSAAFSTYNDNFPQFFHSMIETGEASGTLDACLQRASVTFTQSYKLNSRIKTAMIYPCILGTLACGIVILMMAFVIPQFAKLYESNNAELPKFTLALIGMSNFVVHRWYIIAVIILTVAIAFYLWKSTEKGGIKFDELKIRIPVLKKLMLRVYASRFSRSLSAFVSAGVSITKGINVTARSISNKYVEKQLYTVEEGVTRGRELSGELERIAVFPSMIVYLSKLGEESGTLDEMFAQAADYFDDETNTSIASFVAMLEPLMIILMAAIVIPIVIAIILPVFNMYNTML